MSYDFFSMNTICENAVLHHRLFYCVNELFRVPAIIMLAEQPHLLKNLDRGLYPIVAEKFNSTKERVEKNIRCAIERAWLRGNPTLISEIFGYSINPDQGRPSNAEFLYTVCNYLNR